MAARAGNFLVIFWGGEGSTYLVDTLSRLPEIYVPALEPLERHHHYMEGITLQGKLHWLQWLYSMPAAADRADWLRQAENHIPGMVDRLRPVDDTAYICGIKVRPSVFLAQSGPEPTFTSKAMRWVRDHISLPRVVTKAALRAPGVSRLKELTVLLHRKNCRVIFMRRENVFRQALTMYRMNRQARSQFSKDRSATEINPGILQKHLQDYENGGRLSSIMRQSTSEAGLPVMELAYEDLSAHPVETFCQLSEFLGLPADEQQIEHLMAIGSRFEKTAGDDWRNFVTNHQRLQDHFTGTQWERYL